MKPTAKSIGKKSVTKTAAKKPAAGVRMPPPQTGKIVYAKGAAMTLDFDAVFLAHPLERIEVIKHGVPAGHVDVLAERMDIAKDKLFDTLRLSRATVNRKVRDNQPLSQDESERVLGIESLIGQVEIMVKESGNPEGFDAAKWVSNWLHAPLPALRGETPASYMDTVEGQKLISNLLATAQSGAYA